jgi:adenosine deaminase
MRLVDLHQHTEWPARLDQVLSGAPVDWAARRKEVQAEGLPGMARLQRFAAVPRCDLDGVSAEVYERILESALLSAAEGGASFTELRLPQESVVYPGFMDCFETARQQVAARFPAFDAAAVLSLNLWEPTVAEVCDAFGDAAAAGLAAVELIYVPYAAEAEWTRGRRVAAAAARAGLGVTVPAGAFTTANLAAVAEIEGVSRIGHAARAADDPGVLRLLAERGVTVEVCLTSAVVLAMVERLEAHPLLRLMDAGIAVVLGTDSPLRLGTDIAAEYRKAASLGLTDADLEALTRRAEAARFVALRQHS